MNTAGWWANSTTATRKARWMNTTGTGTASRPGVSSAACAPASSFRKYIVTAQALTKTASAAFQPKVESMKMVSHFQVAATINTGGAPKLVSVPPIETLTNKTPTVAYLKRVVNPQGKHRWV